MVWLREAIRLLYQRVRIATAVFLVLASTINTIAAIVNLQITFAKPSYLDLEYHELLKACESVKAEVAEGMAIAVEKKNRLQANSNLWFKFRAGRVTASRMKAVRHTEPTNLSQSLVKAICYPELFCFTSKQTVWGCRHQKSA